MTFLYRVCIEIFPKGFAKKPKEIDTGNINYATDSQEDPGEGLEGPAQPPSGVDMRKRPEPSSFDGKLQVFAVDLTRFFLSNDIFQSPSNDGKVEHYDPGIAPLRPEDVLATPAQETTDTTVGKLRKADKRKFNREKKAMEEQERKDMETYQDLYSEVRVSLRLGLKEDELIWLPEDKGTVDCEVAWLNHVQKGQ